MTNSTSGALHWMEQPFIIKTNSVKNGCFSPHELFSNCTRDLECHLYTRVFAKTYFLVDVPVGILDFLYVRWAKILNLEEPLVMGTLTWSFYFVNSKYLDYTQYYMMLLELSGHIVVTDLVTVT